MYKSSEPIVFRIFVERKKGFQQEALRLKNEITGFLGISALSDLRYLNRYDIQNIDENILERAAVRIFSEPQSDTYYINKLPFKNDEQSIVWEYLPGQYDQRADSAEQCLSLLLTELNLPVKQSPIVRCAKMIILTGNLSSADMERIQNYLVNPVDSRLAALDMPKTLEFSAKDPADIPVIEGLIDFTEAELFKLRSKMGLAMDNADILFLQGYFQKAKRNPTETEVRVLDTYWSDHCRHTTFNTELTDIQIEQGDFSSEIERSLADYKAMRIEVYGGGTNKKDCKPLSLMDIACIGAKYLRKQGKLDDLEVSGEVNACSIYINVDYTDQSREKWLLMFKNETHNHPTEIEPFGGAATCIGGAIRDPLSGRSWVYQALRLSGSADPRVPIEQTKKGKLPQIKITREAAAGFSSYGNQIGLATGQVAEFYHSGFEAKRMELGAVIAAAPAAAVIREEPENGDCIILIGGGTGRDGIGGATGSSKAHTQESIREAAAEVQKGNAVEERKIQRLFRSSKVSRMIRRCNDFGAGGIAVAAGELADGLEINLDAVPKKYEGLNGTDLAISESQERMAVLVAKKDADTLIAAAEKENLNAALIARVTNTDRLVMRWRGKSIVDIERSFLDSAGAPRFAQAEISSPKREESPLLQPLAAAKKALGEGLKSAWLKNLQDLAVCSRRGLTERFDGSIGAASILFPLGGMYQSTPELGSAAKIPVMYPKETITASLMAFGYDPYLCAWSPWHGAQYAVLQSLTRIAAMGGIPENCRLSFQEYFERLSSRKTWGKPLAAVLGALEAQKAMGTPAIGGKDSMSGSFQNIHVPPTLVSFAVTTTSAANILSGSFKKDNSNLYLLHLPVNSNLVPDFKSFIKNCRFLQQLNDQGFVLAAYPVEAGGIAETLSKMAFGNKIGCTIKGRALEALNKNTSFDQGADVLFLPMYGSLIIELSEKLKNDIETEYPENCLFLGTTGKNPQINIEKTVFFAETLIPLDEALVAWEKPLAGVFPPLSEKTEQTALPDFAQAVYLSPAASEKKSSAVLSFKHGGVKPRVLLPVFPGTNCEYDMARAFSLAGADTRILVFRNKNPQALSDSLKELEREIDSCQIFALSGGFSAGDEPDGSGKFIANVLRERHIADALMNLLENKKGLVLGICNGFQALIKTGLLPYGKILEPAQEMPTLSFNTIGRHVSRVCTTHLSSSLSPWAHHSSILLPNAVFTLPISHGEGRLLLSENQAKELFAKGQVFSQYTDKTGRPSICEPDNPNGSAFAIEGLTSADGRILGKMAHNERTITALGADLLKNVGGNREQNIFAAGVQYFL